MESRFGHDFSQVRVHDDSTAAESARAVNALAYTVGRDVVFDTGRYAPHSASGRHLLAHELAHVLQQGPGTGLHRRGSDLTLEVLDGPAERDAEALAKRAMEDLSVGPARLTGLQMPTATLRRQAAGSHGMAGSGASSTAPAAGPPLSTVKVWVHSFIPMVSVTDPFGYCYTGDGRTFSPAVHASYRTHQEIEFNVTTGAKTIDWVDTGTTHELDRKTCTTVIASAKASTSGLVNGPITASGVHRTFNLTGSASNPRAFYACAIDYNFGVSIDTSRRICSIQGAHDGFPAYEIYVTANGGAGVPVYTYDPVAAGEGPTALCGGLDKSASGSASF